MLIFLNGDKKTKQGTCSFDLTIINWNHFNHPSFTRRGRQECCFLPHVTVVMMTRVVWNPLSIAQQENMPPRTLLHCLWILLFCFVSCDRRGFLAEFQSQTIHKEVSSAFSDHKKTLRSIIHFLFFLWETSFFIHKEQFGLSGSVSNLDVS